MGSEEKIILAFIFSRSGKEKLTLSEIYLPLSMDLKWFSPKQAKDFVNQALERKLLVKRDGLIKTGFDIKNVEIPVGFHPSIKTFEQKKYEKVEDFEKTENIVTGILKKTNLSEEKILEKIREVEKEKNICFDVAALLVGKEYGVSLEDFFEEVEDKIFIENKE